MKTFSNRSVTKVHVAFIAVIIIVAAIAITYYLTLPAPSPPPEPFYYCHFDRAASSGFEATYLDEDSASPLDAFNLSRRGSGTVVMVFTSNISATIEFEWDDLRLDPPPPPSGIELKVDPPRFTLKPDTETQVNLIITANVAETLPPLQFEASISFDFNMPASGTVGSKVEFFLLTIV